MNRSPELLWGLVSNGLRLRVLRDNASLTRQAYVEFDLEPMMTGEAYSERDYEDLVRTLLDIRETAPALGRPLSTVTPALARAQAVTPATPSDVFVDIKITRVIVEDVTQPRNDGTPGSALYAVPFAFSRRPPSEWAQLFVALWDQPPRWTSMHRPGIARKRRTGSISRPQERIPGVAGL